MSCKFSEYCITSQGFQNYKLLGASQQALPFIAISQWEIKNHAPAGNQHSAGSMHTSLLKKDKLQGLQRFKTHLYSQGYYL